MSDLVQVSGMVLKAFDHAEYDRRVILLTRQTGKITVFAKGVRRQGSKNMASTEPFVYGQFKLFEGKNAYNLAEADIENYFEELRLDMEKMCYASFFTDAVERTTKENNDEAQILKLLYRSMQGLLSPGLTSRFVSTVFSLKLLMENGVYGGSSAEEGIENGTKLALDHIMKSEIKDIFAFRVSDSCASELDGIAKKRLREFVGTGLKSLEVMKDMGYN
ncbi:MAG: DNA repair protein RecO [Lachnospiraceae bacterium]|nr:DNA repair protein RecO [Lachnospiraceae bacterium]